MDLHSPSLHWLKLRALATEFFVDPLVNASDDFVTDLKALAAVCLPEKECPKIEDRELERTVLAAFFEVRAGGLPRRWQSGQRVRRGRGAGRGAGNIEPVALQRC